jgi:leucyl-tRNA synthetase
MINQGMILGESAFVKRGAETGKFYSEGATIEEEFQKIHADVNLVNTSNELDIEGFKKFRPEFKDAEFILQDGNLYGAVTSPLGKPDGASNGASFLVSREVEKMSKSKYNVINPDDVCDEYGADALRLFEMFLGPIDQAKPWNTAGLSGVVGFLKKFWKLYHQGENASFYVQDSPPSEGLGKASGEAFKALHQTIKKVNEDIEEFSFNTSVSAFMICVNELLQLQCNNRAVLEPLCVLLSPFAPHICEEIWEKLGHSESIEYVAYPVHEEKYLKEDSKTYPISFNGKMRYTLDLSLDLSKDEIEKIVMADERTKKQLGDRTPKKVIIVPGKIVNIVG